MWPPAGLDRCPPAAGLDGCPTAAGLDRCRAGTADVESGPRLQSEKSAAAKASPAAMLAAAEAAAYVVTAHRAVWGTRSCAEHVRVRNMGQGGPGPTGAPKGSSGAPRRP